MTDDGYYFFDKRVKGLIIGSYSNNWVYRDDGKFDTVRLDDNDIVKIIRR